MTAVFEGYSPPYHDVRIRDAGGQVCNVASSRFGAVGDGITDDTAAIQAAIDEAGSNGNGIVYFPDSPFLGTTVYLVTTLHLNTSGVMFVGSSANTVRIESRSGDVFSVADSTVVVAQTFWRDLFICSLPGASAGHCINVIGSLSQSVFFNVQFYQYNDAKSVLYSLQDTGGGGIFDVTVMFSYIHYSPTATINAVYCKGVGNPASANRFLFSRIQGGGVPAFRLEAGPGAYVSSNCFDSLNFEVCDHGAIEIYSGLNTNLRNIGMFDNTTISHDLIYVGRASTSCPQSRGTVIEGYSRTNGSLSGTVVDINIASGGNVGSNLLSGISGTSSAGVIIDVGAASGFTTLVGIDSDVTVKNFVATRSAQLDAASGLRAPVVTTGTGATAARPTGIVSGALWFDTTLGKPIWYNGTNWVDATGATV